MRILIGLLFITLIACQTPQVPQAVLDSIETVKGKYAPDKRVNHFKIEAVMENGQLVLKGESNLPKAVEDLKAELEKKGIGYIENILLLPEAKLEGKEYGVVRLSACNIRSNPKHSAELATQATMGTPLKVYKQEGDWYFVQTPDGYLGWLDQGGFAQMTKEEYDSWAKAPKRVISVDFEIARFDPDPNARVVSDLLGGNILLDLGQENGYQKLGYPDGRTGYIEQGKTMDLNEWLSTRKPDAENVLESAQALLGRPYLWGGTSAKAMDCSGFTKTVFYLNGLMLPRDASQQVHTGIDIETDTSWQNLIPGDLLFFGRKASADQKEKITHVAIYMGEGKIIHAAGIVKVESLKRGDADFSEYRFNQFVRAKRLLSSIGDKGVVALQDSWYAANIPIN